MPQETERQGCAMTPGLMIALGFMFLWIMVIVPLYQKWRYPTKPGDEHRRLAENARQLDMNDLAEEISRRADHLEKYGTLPEPEGKKAAPKDVPGFLLKQADEKRSAGEEGHAALLEKAAAVLAGKPLPETAAAPGTEVPGTGVTVAARGPPRAAVEKPPAPPASPASPEASKLKERRFAVETEELRLQFTSRGAAVERACLRNFTFRPGDEEPLEILLPLGGEGPGDNSFILRDAGSGLGDLAGTVWEVLADGSEAREDGFRLVSFKTASGGVEIRKTFVLPPEGFVLGMELELSRAEGAGSSDREVELDLMGPNGIVPDDVPGRYQITAMLAGRTGADSKIKYKTVSAKNASKKEIAARSLSMRLTEWAAVKNRYFAAVLQCSEPLVEDMAFAEAVEVGESFASDRRLGQKNVRVGFRLNRQTPAEISFRAYLGPMRPDLLAAASKDEETGRDGEFIRLISYGRVFGWLSQLLFGLLKGLHFFTRYLGSIIGGYGLAIIMVTIIVNLGMHPIRRKGLASMHKMQKLNPEMRAIRKKHEKDKSREGQRKMQVEIMELYKKHGVSPLGGCLPLLLQFPMFIALYGMLRTTFELRHARFLWIADLSNQDQLIRFPRGFMIPLMGWTSAINLLPIAYLVLFLVQQKLAPQSDDPQQAQQRTMMKFMSVFLFVIFYNMPAGLVLYFVCSSLFGLFEQRLIRKSLDAAPAQAAPSAPGPARDGPPPPTSWDKDAERRAKQAEKRKQRGGRKGPWGS